MTQVYTQASMSLDGYISGPDYTGFEHLFKWLSNGDVAIPTTHPDMTPHLTATSAELFRSLIESTGALVVGRGVFDHTGGWGGEHPLGAPVVVVTHSVPDGWPREDAPFTFVTDGIERAIEQAKALAGDKLVGVNGGTIAPARRRHAVLRPARARPGRAGGPNVGRRGDRRHPPALPRPPARRLSAGLLCLCSHGPARTRTWI